MQSIFRLFALILAACAVSAPAKATDVITNYQYVYEANWWSVGFCSGAGLGNIASCLSGSQYNVTLVNATAWGAQFTACGSPNCPNPGITNVNGGCNTGDGWEPATTVNGTRACRKPLPPGQCPSDEVYQDGKCVSKCEALKDGNFDLKGTILKGSPALTLCRNNGDASCSYDVSGGRTETIINGGTGDYVYTAGSGTWTGQPCTTPNTTPPTQTPPETSAPKGPQDCPANTEFAYVEGKGTCLSGKKPDNNTSDYCKSPDHKFEKTCGEGGEEFCKANPQTYACIPGSERYCTLKPASASCQPGNADFCKANTDHASCQPGTKEYCATHPGDQACAVKQAEECANNPAIQNSDACKKAEQCAKYPNDPACKTSSGSTGGAQSDYCKQFPNDSKCLPGAFAGSCEAGFVCKGDAVMCALTREVHRQGCANKETAPEEELPASDQQRINAVLNGTDAGNAALPGKGNGSPTSVSDLFGTNIGGLQPAFGPASAECPAPRRITVEVMGYSKELEIPFTPACRVAELMANVLVALSTLAAIRIAFVR